MKYTEITDENKFYKISSACYDRLSSGSESTVYLDGENILKIFTAKICCDDGRILAQNTLSNLDQQTYVGFDNVYTNNGYVIAGTHKFIEGNQLIKGLKDIDLELLSKFIKKIYIDTKKISDEKILINDAQFLNVFVNQNGIYFIDTTRFKVYSSSDEIYKPKIKNRLSLMDTTRFKSHDSSDEIYRSNIKSMLSLIDECLFFLLKKDDILKPIKKELIKQYNSKENMDEALLNIKYDFCKYYDSEIKSMNDILAKMNVKRK